MTMKEEYTAIDMATAAADGFRAGQRVAQSVGVPDGWKMVPVEPTPEMLEAASKCYGNDDDCYRDMLAAAPTVKAEQAPTPEFVWVRLLEALAGDNGCPFTASTDDYREAKPALVQLIAAGLFRDDADSLDGDIWTIAAGEQSEAAARFASCADAYAVLSDVLNRVFERPDEAPSLPAAGSAVEEVVPQYQRGALLIDSDTMSRFTRIAREAAISGVHRYSYMPTTPEEAKNWHPHSWVIDAMHLVQRDALSALSAQQSAHVSMPTDAELVEMARKLVRCQCCATEYPHDSYDAGFIAGSGMCQVCDAAIPAVDLPSAAPAEQPYPHGIAEDLERSDWAPLEALQWYAAGKHFDVVGGRTRIIDTGAVASNALKHASLDRPELKGDAGLSELRAALSAQQSAPDRVSVPVELLERLETWVTDDCSALEELRALLASHGQGE
jgi:hypothetical protein